jgi:hypothetical protein
MAMTPKYQVVMKVNQKSGVKSAQQQVDDWQDAARTKGMYKCEIFFVNNYGSRSTNVSTFGNLCLVYSNDNVCFE